MAKEEIKVFECKCKRWEEGWITRSNDVLLYAQNVKILIGINQ
ncbi:MAG: hypothetical protein QXJ93_02120 [Candidatus Rehaiarchaeum fermentans]|nr:hypothetical protein [Candidatus Rehaiarchaeum fermentans]